MPAPHLAWHVWNEILGDFSPLKWVAVLRVLPSGGGGFFKNHPPFSKGRFPSGQREQTVNLSAQPSKVRILPSPFF